MTSDVQGAAVMKWNYIRLADDDQKARDWIQVNLETCAHNHTLSRKLLNRFSSRIGPMVAIIPEWVHLDQFAAYSHGSVPPPGDYAPGDSPLDRLVIFVREYLQAAKDAIAVCENSGQV